MTVAGRNWRDDPTVQANHAATLVIFGADAAVDPMWLRAVMSDGKPIVYARCPGCGEWAELDDDQLRGRVSTHHDVPECGYHETKNWWADHVA